MRRTAYRRVRRATAPDSPAWSRASRDSSGLRPTYIVAQLTRWRVGERHAAEPDCMRRIVFAHVGRRHRGGRGVACAAEAAQGSVTRIVQPRPHAARVRQPAVEPWHVASASPVAFVIVVVLAVAAWIALRPGMLPSRANGGGRNDADHQQGRVPRARGRLHRVPHRARRQGVRGRAGDADAVRQSLRPEHHARRRDRHRALDRRTSSTG